MNLQHSVKAILLVFLVSATVSGKTLTPKNKLLEMFRFFYLPFEIDFAVGETPDEVIPLVQSRNQSPQVISPEQMQKLDQKWSETRKVWSARSLFLSTRDSVNGSTTISPHLITHRIAANRGAYDALPLEERIRLKELLRNKPQEIQASVLQKQFVRTFINPGTSGKMHFFIVAPDWCASSETYRTLLEYYAKKFALGNFVLHSVIIEDPSEQIFDSKALTDLFPFPKRYSHESVPRFLLAEERNGELTIKEEGNALHQLYEGFFEPQRGFLEAENPIRRNSPTLGPSLSKVSY